MKTENSPLDFRNWIHWAKRTEREWHRPGHLIFALALAVGVSAFCLGILMGYIVGGGQYGYPNFSIGGQQIGEYSGTDHTDRNSY